MRKNHLQIILVVASVINGERRPAKDRDSRKWITVQQ
jgi:hypothetical protein